MSVRELIRTRRAEATLRGARTDPHHLALVIEGGGMRGVVAGGMVSALEELGLLNCFDSIYGSSAGACAGAYFLAGQAKLGTSIYYEDINNKNFINIWRALIGRPIMSTPFLIDHVMRTIKPLNVDEIRRHPSVLHIAATRASTGEPVVYSRFEDTEDFFRKLKASISIPIIAGLGVMIGSELIFDGGMSQQIPVMSAIEDGPTHMLVLITRRAHEARRPERVGPYRLDELILGIVYGWHIAKEYRNRNGRTNEVISAVLSEELHVKGKKIIVDHVLRPETGLGVSRLSTDGGLLRRAAEEAHRAVIDRLKL
jgi:predicted patatin/cPLA2 family phospholipase